MTAIFNADFIAAQNAALSVELDARYDSLRAQLDTRGIDIETITDAVGQFGVAIPSWGVGTGGTRFARFPGAAEPRNVFEKLEDCAVIQTLGRSTPTVSIHFPWDLAEDLHALREHAERLGLRFDAVNSNTFQDQPGQAHSYKFGSLTHTDSAVRNQAIEHNLRCIEFGRILGSNAITVWIGDGGNFPGQQHFAHSLERYLDSTGRIYSALPDDWRMYLEHKLYEPALYSTVIQDWGTSVLCAMELGPRALSLVDLGHHAHGVNIEMIVARLIQFEKLAGFHFNDSKYGDDDLDSGSINPYQLFLVFNELVDAAYRKAAGFDPAYMLDQSHNVTDPIESLISSGVEVQRAYAQALLVNREALYAHQENNDALMASHTLKTAYNTDVSPILAMSRQRAGGAIDPILAYRAGNYRQQIAGARPAQSGTRSGIV